MEKQNTEIKIGDLVCYNAAGQKKKTLGLVLDIQTETYYGVVKSSLLIQWCCIGNGVLPRAGYNSPYVPAGGREVIGTGSIVWHEFGEWFEVVK